MSINALDIKNATVRNGEFWLRDISFEGPKGSIAFYYNKYYNYY